VQILRSKLRIPLELLPVSVPTDERNLVDLVSVLEEDADCMVAEIMEMQVVDTAAHNRACEVRRQAAGVVGEDLLGRLRLRLNDLPGFAQQRYNLVIAELL
jgi:hypothetical protein